jgi:hypothetical protein
MQKVLLVYQVENGIGNVFLTTDAVGNTLFGIQDANFHQHLLADNLLHLGTPIM